MLNLESDPDNWLGRGGLGLIVLTLFCTDIYHFIKLTVTKDDALDEKKPIKKRIKELKILDPKIAQNLCKYGKHFTVGSAVLLERIYV